MTPKGVALVARASKERLQIARSLRDGGYEVFECEELSIPSRFAGVVVIDDQEAAEPLRARVLAWIKLRRPPRVVVVSSKPAGWKALALAHSDHLFVLAAPSFAWEIIDALRASPPERPRHA